MLIRKYFHYLPPPLYQTALFTTPLYQIIPACIPYFPSIPLNPSLVTHIHSLNPYTTYSLLPLFTPCFDNLLSSIPSPILLYSSSQLSDIRLPYVYPFHPPENFIFQQIIPFIPTFSILLLSRECEHSLPLH